MLQISLAFGLAVFIGVHLTSSISGGNLNPAVTFGLFLTGRIGLFKLVFYIIAQCLGGIGILCKKQIDFKFWWGGAIFMIFPNYNDSFTH